MTIFADIISFFGLASFFAWLAFVVFQNEQLDEYADESLKRQGRGRLFRVYDFFIVSFASYAIAYVADYLLHFRNGTILFGFDTYEQPILYGIIGAFSLLGLLTLVLPTVYIRSLARGDTTPLRVNPPPFSRTFLLFILGGINFIAALQELGAILFLENNSLWTLWRIFWSVILLVSAGGFLRSLRDWDASRRRIILNTALLFLPLFLFPVAAFLLTHCPSYCIYLKLLG